MDILQVLKMFLGLINITNLRVSFIFISFGSSPIGGLTFSIWYYCVLIDYIPLEENNRMVIFCKNYDRLRVASHLTTITIITICSTTTPTAWYQTRKSLYYEDQNNKIHSAKLS